MSTTRKVEAAARRRTKLAGLGLLVAVALVTTARAESCAPSERVGSLPPATLRGADSRLQEYPSIRLATAEQHAAAVRLLARIRAAARSWPTVRAAAAAGFDTRTARRKPWDRSVHYFHAEHAPYGDGYDHLDPWQPKALIYANLPDRPLRLVGLMFSMPRGMLGATPGGPITRWHTHTVCARGGHRGLAPLPNGSCPRGTSSRQGSEMMHVWLTPDLRSAFAIHAPARELGLPDPLHGSACRF